jgi:hypothetical protein
MEWILPEPEEMATTSGIVDQFGRLFHLVQVCIGIQVISVLFVYSGEATIQVNFQVLLSEVICTIIRHASIITTAVF